MRPLKYHLNGFIYNLVYPGFVGSMIYDLIFRYYNKESSSPYWTTETWIKWLITAFYCLDFVHLYGDIDRRVKLKKRGFVYFFCDIAVAFTFFIAFANANETSYFLSAILICLVPIPILWYKSVLKIDVWFHRIFAFLGISGIALLFRKKYFVIKEVEAYNYQSDILIYLIAGLVIYSIYFVFLYKEPASITKEWNEQE